MNENTNQETRMIEMTYCGGKYYAGTEEFFCGQRGEPCRKCLKRHIARLEARVGELEAELKDIRDATAWLSNVDPDEIKDEELHNAALIDFRRWERISRQPGAVGNRVYHFEDFLVTHAREQGRRAALVEAKAGLAVPDLTDEEVDAYMWDRNHGLVDSDEDWVRWSRRVGRWAYALAVSRISASRALKEGERDRHP